MPVITQRDKALTSQEWTASHWRSQMACNQSIRNLMNGRPRFRRVDQYSEGWSTNVCRLSSTRTARIRWSSWPLGVQFDGRQQLQGVDCSSRNMRFSAIFLIFPVTSSIIYDAYEKHLQPFLYFSFQQFLDVTSSSGFDPSRIHFSRVFLASCRICCKFLISASPRLLSPTGRSLLQEPHPPHLPRFSAQRQRNQNVVISGTRHSSREEKSHAHPSQR